MPMIHIADEDSKSSRISDIYASPFGTPYYWRDEVSGVLPAAVDVYFTFVIGEGPKPTTDQLELVIDYIRYHINAPCWQVVGEFGVELARLREQARELATVDDIAKYIDAALEIAVDPF